MESPPSLGVPDWDPSGLQGAGSLSSWLSSLPGLYDLARPCGTSGSIGHLLYLLPLEFASTLHQLSLSS